MPYVIQPFNNTDLHNIYEAIIAGGGGGGDALAGLLLNGSVNPDNLSGFYPARYASIDSNITNIAYLLNGTDNPIDPDGFYPSILQNIYDAISSGTDLAGDLLNGTIEPSNLGGFYPTNINNILYFVQSLSEGLVTGTLYAPQAGVSFSYADAIYKLFDIQENQLPQIEAYTSSTAVSTSNLYRLLDGSSNPSSTSGFYPDTLFKIKENTSNTEVAIKKSTEVGTGGTGGSVNGYGQDGFASNLLAASSLATYLNSLSGVFTIINITFTDRGGSNGHGYCVIYK